MSKNNNNINNNNNDDHKKLRLREETSKNGGVKSSDTNTDVSNWILIMDDSIVKQVRVTNYHVKWKTAKFMLRAFRVQR